MRVGGSTFGPATAEADRAIERYGLLTAPVDKDLQALSDLAARVFSTPHAAINILTTTSQLQVATTGLEPAACAREDSMCAGLVVEDAQPPQRDAVGGDQGRRGVEPDAELAGDERVAGEPVVEPGVGHHDRLRHRGHDEVTVRRSGELVADRVGAALLPLVLLGLGLTVAAFLVVRVLAARLSRPFRELADVADAIGQGRFDVPIPHYRVGEAEAISSSMRRGISRLAELRRRERDIATNASHELRSPISALRMEIEDLASWPETPPQVAEELTSYLPQLDRLNAAVRTYLDEAQAQRLMDVDVVDLSALVRQALATWRTRLRTGPGPALVLVDEPAAPLHVCASDQAVADILDRLLQDAVDRQATHVLVEVDCTEGFGRVRMELEGEQAPADEEARAAAATTALAVGGRLTATDGHTLLMLRRAGETADDDADVAPASC